MGLVRRALARHLRIRWAMKALTEFQVFQHWHPRNVGLRDDVIQGKDILKLILRVKLG